jgi:STE24 endopeptidase
VQSTFGLIVFLGFWFAGGFGWLDGAVQDVSESIIVRGLLFIGALFLANHILMLPFAYYDTFVIEEEFEFNKSTRATFVADQIKGLLVGVVIAVPLLALLIYLFDTFELAWLYAWIVVAAWIFLMQILAPALIMPIFNKFEPLEDGELKTGIEAMSKKCEFPLAEVSVMDGSKRSTKSNAFFTGMGKTKRIALFDTLIKNHSTRELVAVLAHEIGHFKKKHLLTGMAMRIGLLGITLFLLGLFIKADGLYEAFGVEPRPVYAGLVLFAFLLEPLSKVFSILSSILSRKHEFEADAYAAEVTESPDHLITALKSLSRDNLSNLTPHPFYVFMYYSHPTVMERIRAMRGSSS